MKYSDMINMSENKGEATAKMMLALKEKDGDAVTFLLEKMINAPKNIERLEEISKLRNIQRKMEEEEDDEILKISDEDVSLGNLDIHIINPPEVKLEPDMLLDDIEILS